MGTTAASVVFAASLFAGTLGCLLLGWRMGRKRLGSLGENSLAGLGALEGAVFGLMGLLLAFTFTGAAGRFHARRDIITQHVNAIGTAWLRLDLLSDATRDEIRGFFRRYVDAVSDVVGHAGDDPGGAKALDRLSEIQEQIWDKAIRATKTDKSQPLAQVLLPALNEMFDLATARIHATRQHPPIGVFLMLGLLVLVSSLMAGFGMARSESLSPLHVFGYAAITAASVYFILDIEYPRLGLVQIRNFDQAMVELRDSMN
jgi:hypothetical protein